MKIGKLKELNEFLDAVNKCKRDVWLESPEGDRFNLKSTFSQYIAMGTLLSERGDSLELFCASREDEEHFMKFFRENPEVLAKAV